MIQRFYLFFCYYQFHSKDGAWSLIQTRLTKYHYAHRRFQKVLLHLQGDLPRQEVMRLPVPVPV